MFDLYVRDIPRGVPYKMLAGAAVVGTVTLLAGHSSKVALAAATVSAATTVVEAMTRPFTRALMNNVGFPRIFGMITQLTISPLIVLRIAREVSPLFAQGNAAYHQYYDWFFRCIIFNSLNSRFYTNNMAISAV